MRAPAAVLGSLRQGVAVLDRDLRLLAWNQRSEELWGVRQQEAIGQRFLGLDIGLPVQQLRTPLQAVLENGGSESVQLDAVNRRGRPIRCNVRVTPLMGGPGAIRGAIVLMEDMPDGA